MRPVRTGARRPLRDRREPPRGRRIALIMGVAVLVLLGAWWWVRRQAPPRVVPVPPTGPCIAIVLDDWGYNTRNVPALVRLHRRVTVAVLPRLPYSSTVARQARAAGCEVILHLPMESHRRDTNPRFRMEAKTLLTSMPDREVDDDVAEALSSVPGCRGVSNHQGSKGTEDTRLMRDVLRQLKTRGLYFLDSLSTPHSVGQAVAREVGVPYARRQRFLDNDDRASSIEAQVRALAADARARGAAVGIGHDRPMTLAVLERLLPQLEAQGVRCVYVSELVR